MCMTFWNKVKVVSQVTGKKNHSKSWWGSVQLSGKNIHYIMVNIYRQKLKSKISVNVVQEAMEKLFHNFVFSNNDASTV